jgi:hypothetical protein
MLRGSLGLHRRVPLAERGLRLFWGRTAALEQKLSELEQKLAVSEHEARIARQQHQSLAEALQKEDSHDSKKVALLIDAENASAKTIELVMEEVSRFGSASVSPLDSIMHSSRAVTLCSSSLVAGILSHLA